MGTVKVLVIGVALGYLVVAALVWAAQEHLMFHPRPAPERPSGPRGWLVEEVRHATSDGTRLEGLLVRPSPERGPLVIYYGGNAEEVTEAAGTAESSYGTRATLYVNYRGYGRSQGSPGERALVADAIEIFDWAARRPDVDPTRIALHGRSLGSGVAVQVAAARPARCVMLTSPFASARELAGEIYYWLPVKVLMRHPFDSLARAAALRMPALFLVGEADSIIPPRHSERLAEAWGGPVERVRFAGFGHNDIGMHPGYDEALRAFLARCL
jgi:fermentation-respiration switch protein FrsA (DUF1100 family)